MLHPCAVWLLCVPLCLSLRLPLPLPCLSLRLSPRLCLRISLRLSSRLSLPSLLACLLVASLLASLPCVSPLRSFLASLLASLLRVSSPCAVGPLYVALVAERAYSDRHTRNRYNCILLIGGANLEPLPVGLALKTNLHISLILQVCCERPTSAPLGSVLPASGSKIEDRVCWIDLPSKAARIQEWSDRRVFVFGKSSKQANFASPAVEE
jgi:hypothetical protein